MRNRAFILICLLVCAAAPGRAQEGHPLTGTWGGDWGPSGTQRNHLTFVMAWDGDKVTGTINPGPDAITVTSVIVDYTNWTVRIEADTRDKVHISAEGKLAEIGSYHRTLTGTWQQGTTKGDFKLTRD